MRNNYIESKIQEDIDIKNWYRIKNIHDPLSIREATSKSYVDNKFNAPIIIKNSDHVDLIDKKLNNVRFIKVNCFPAISEHLTAELFVYQASSNCVDESSVLLR